MTNDDNIQWGGSSITYECWKYIYDNYENNSNIVEFGAGQVSTTQLAKYYKGVSFESSIKWTNKIKELLNTNNWKVINAPLKNMFYDDNVIKKIYLNNINSLY